MADFNPDEYLASKEQSGGFDPASYLEGKGVTGPGTAMQVVGGVGRVLDYLGGLGRTAYEGVTSDDVTKEEVLKALKGDAPTSAQRMIQRGAEPGFATEAKGMAKDIALDPLTYVGMGPVLRAGKAGVQPLLKAAFKSPSQITEGTKALGKIASGVIRPTATLSEKSGTGLFRMGVKKLDQAAIKANKEPVSNILLNYGIGGTEKNIANKSVELAQELGTQRNALIKRVGETGATVNIPTALVGAEKAAQKMLTDPGTKSIAEQYLKVIKEYKNAGEIPITRANEWKTTLYEKIGDAGFMAAKNTKAGKKIEKSMAFGIKTGIENSAEKAIPGAGKKIATINDQWGTLLSTAKKMGSESMNAQNRKYITQVDAMAAAYSPWLYTVKQAGKLAGSTFFKTRGGQALRGVSRVPGLDVGVRRGLLNIAKSSDEY